MLCANVYKEESNTARIAILYRKGPPRKRWDVLEVEICLDGKIEINLIAKQCSWREAAGSIMEND